MWKMLIFVVYKYFMGNIELKGKFCEMILKILGFWGRDF